MESFVLDPIILGSDIASEMFKPKTSLPILSSNARKYILWINNISNLTSFVQAYSQTYI